MTWRRAQRRRALERPGRLGPRRPAAPTLAGAVSVAAATKGDHPLTTRRATKPQTSATKAREAPSRGPGRGGRDRRTAQEYAADLASETDRSLARDPKRWTPRQTNKVPKDRTEPEALP
jgi:hypothetical protein